ncbi:MAG TPA: hypothetical protein H9765_13025 [Candidatus Mediterraneibacter intestinigallinarum]|nr:hypothetical protein [Candidatus Mediterraneibacter intestinigallinarum]
MTKHHIPRIPLDERINMAGTRKDPQAVFSGNLMKRGAAAIGIQEYVGSIMRIMEDPGLEELAKENPFRASYDQDETLDRYFENNFEEKTRQIWLRHVYRLFILPFARMSENTDWIGVDTIENLSDDELPFN